MNILYIATSFPEPTKGATIYTDLAEALHEAGHDITVAVSEQTRNKRYTEMKKERGFDVLRIVTGNYYDVSFIEKGITTLKIPVMMRIGIKKYLRGRKFDFILFESPPVTNAGLIAWAKKQFNCPAYLMLKDIFPQNAVDLGIIKNNSILFRYFTSKEKKLYKTADYIGCMSYANKNYLLSSNTWLDLSKVEIFPNTIKADSNASNVYREDFLMRKRYSIPTKACVFLFGGNMGRPQSIELLCKAIKEFKDNIGIYFLFVGRGTERHKLKDTIRKYNVTNALLIENLPRDEYEQIIKECDVGLIVLDPRFTIPNFPSRILSYMKYAKPVLAVTDKFSDLRILIEEAQCGEWVYSGDFEAFISKVNEIIKMSDFHIKGSNGLQYLHENFTIERSVKILEKHFEKHINEA